MDDLPQQWRDAFQRDETEPPPFPDPLPERRLARLLAAYIVTGLAFLVLPGTVLGVWNLIGISSQRQLAAVSTAWIQAHGHAQFLGWVGTFVIGISLYTLPKFRGALTRSVPAGWVMWALWTGAVGLRWAAGVSGAPHPMWFRVSAAFEFGVAVALVWQVSGRPRSRRARQAWEAPVFGGFAALAAVLAWQLWLTLQPFDGTSLPEAPDRLLITAAIWCFAFPVVVGYSAKFFQGLIGAPAAHATGLGIAAALAMGALLPWTVAAGAATCAAAATAAWALRVFEHPKGKPKTTGVYARYPQFTRFAYVWLAIAAALNFGVARPGLLGASRHAFTVGYLATMIFALGPRILPSFLNSRELWSPRLMRVSLWLLTIGCSVRVISEPLAYNELSAMAWKTLPVSAFCELTAVLLFACNIAMSLATPVPAWFGRAHTNDRMYVSWLVGSYPATRAILIDAGLATLARAERIPKSLSVRDAAEADGVDPAVVVERLGAFFESRLPASLRQPLRTSESTRSTKE